MAVNRGLSTTIASGHPLYRITSILYSSGNRASHRRVVNGRGALTSVTGARYNYPGVQTVYLTDDLETCFAEKMFYFHREVVRGIDQFHNLGVVPPFQQTFALWEVLLKHEVTDVVDFNIPGAPNFFGVFPSLPLNPSQDYDHLKQKRAYIQSEGYRGILVGSSRAKNNGNLVVLFDDQSANLQSITPYPVDFRLMDENGDPFVNHSTQILDFTAGEIRFTGSALDGAEVYTTWQRIDFNH